MTGQLTLSVAPTASPHAATKGYVDDQVQTSVSKAGGTMTGSLSLAGVPSLPAHAASKSYVDTLRSDTVPLAGATMSGALALPGDPSTAMQAATKQYVDARLQRAGDTMVGQLTLAADPTAVGHAATKRYVDTQVGTTLAKAGGTMSGGLVLATDPSASLQAATKQYVDAKLTRAGDTLTGALVLASDPTLPMQAATKQYVDALPGQGLPKAGGTLTGSLTLAADPTTSLQAATKQYVDRQVASPMAAGGTLTGPLVLAGNPTTSLQAATKQYVDTGLDASLKLAGGTLSGSLVLASDPTLTQHAATKRYVDANPGRDRVLNVTLPPYNAKLDGVTDDTAAFKAAYQAAPAGSAIYVPNGTAVVQSPGAWGISLTKRVKWIVDGTVTSTGSVLGDAIPTGTGPSTIILPGVVVGHTGQSVSVSQGQSQTTDFSTLHTSLIVNHNGGSASVLANSRSDTIIYNSPANFVWGGLDRIIWSGISTPDSANPAQHVARYVQTVRQVVATDANGAPYPQPELWTACLEYRDVTGKPSSWVNDSLVVEMDWVGNGADDARNRQIQSLVVAQHDPNGAPVEVANVIGVYLASGSSGKTYKVFNIGIPFATAVLDTTASQQLSGAAAIRMAAGHAIAFEPTASNKLAFDSATGTLRWYQGVLSYAVGKGLSVGWQNVVSANITLNAYLAGNIIFLVGSSVYTVTLPAANTVAAGTGFTFSALGSGTVSIAPNTNDLIDLAPVTLRQNDRYHIVSDGVSTWREVFRSNSMGPRFGAPPVLPSYLVANLPASATAGAKAFATNGRKPADLAGAGTGVEVFYDGLRWISVCSGTQVAA